MHNIKNPILYLVTNPSSAANIQDRVFVRYKLNAYTRVAEILQAHIQNILIKNRNGYIATRCKNTAKKFISQPKLMLVKQNKGP